MKYETATIFLAFLSATSAAPVPEPKNVFTIPRGMLSAREVPQEKSHQKFLDGVKTSLDLNNPNNIKDPVFGLLGNAAAADGAGSITNLDCLKQATADQAFTNAKAAGDIKGQSDALIYQALERNTGSVGLKSVACNETAVNPEIAAVKPHQDPASDGAAAENKAIVLELAKQLAAVGADPQDALLSGTFAPGTIGDKTAAGNTCDTADCIFDQNRLVNDATAAEIDAAVAGISAGTATSSAAGNATTASTTTKAAQASATSATKASATKATASAKATASSTAAASAATATAAATGATAATGTNVQTFTGTLGGTAPPVTSSAGTRPFTVNGNTFVGKGAALQRSCAIQNNACANAVNSGTLTGSTTADCNAQEKDCNAAAGSTAKRALDFGSCGSPAVQFAAGLDGRKENSFQAVDQTSFNHGSALKIDVISSFICGQLSSKCKAGAATITACKTGQAAAANLTGQASADAFNSALGV
jgi:hypothetical protein